MRVGKALYQALESGMDWLLQEEFDNLALPPVPPAPKAKEPLVSATTSGPTDVKEPSSQPSSQPLQELSQRRRATLLPLWDRLLLRHP